MQQPAPCASCAAGPTTIVGHGDLFVQSFMGGSDVMCKCRVCGTLWTRRYGPDRTFTWLLGEGKQGALVP